MNKNTSFENQTMFGAVIATVILEVCRMTKSERISSISCCIKIFFEFECARENKAFIPPYTRTLFYLESYDFFS